MVFDFYQMECMREQSQSKISSLQLEVSWKRKCLENLQGFEKSLSKHEYCTPINRETETRPLLTFKIEPETDFKSYKT